jgi:hypothetical protein
LAATEPPAADNASKYPFVSPLRTVNTNTGNTGIGIIVIIPAKKLTKKILPYSKYCMFENKSEIEYRANNLSN